MVEKTPQMTQKVALILFLLFNMKLFVQNSTIFLCRSHYRISAWLPAKLPGDGNSVY